MSYGSPTRDLLRHVLPRPLRNWLRAPGRSLSRLGDEIQYALGRRPTVRLRPDWTLRCHPAAARVFRRAQVADPLQAAELDDFATHCRAGMVLFDLGAHFGVFSLAALRYGGPTARAVAVEPSPTAARMARLLGRLNGSGTRLRVIEAAAARSDGQLRMLSVGVQADDYFVRDDGTHPRRDTTTVQAKSLDSLAAGLDLRPTHVKIDVEGAEAEVLRGGAGLLRSGARPALFVELHNGMARREGRDPAEPLRLLAEYGYGRPTIGGAPAAEDRVLEPDLVRVVVMPR